MNKFIDWIAFCQEVINKLNLNLLKDNEDADTAVEHWITTIQRAGWKATPIVHHTTYPSHTKLLLKNENLGDGKPEINYNSTRQPGILKTC